MSLDVEQNDLHQQLLLNGDDPVDNKQFQSNYIDVIIATMITFILPISCMLIEQRLGALIPLLMYYGCCILIVRLRRGSFTYKIPNHNRYYWIYLIFIPLLIIVRREPVVAKPIEPVIKEAVDEEEEPITTSACRRARSVAPRSVIRMRRISPRL